MNFLIFCGVAVVVVGGAFGIIWLAETCYYLAAGTNPLGVAWLFAFICVLIFTIVEYLDYNH